MPTAEAKAAAWTLLVDTPDLANQTIEEVGIGFQRVHDNALLTPYVDKYFAAVPEIWSRRSSEVAQTVVNGLYPSWEITSEALAKADEFLSNDHPTALKRLIIEGRAGVERSLRARGFDAE